MNGSLRWKDLALNLLFPVDEIKEEGEKAAQARKLASGASSNHPPPLPPFAQEQTLDEDEEDGENDENENEDNDEDENEGDSSVEGIEG